VDHLARDRQAQLEAVPGVLARRGGFPDAKAERSAYGEGEQQRPVLHGEVRSADQRARHEGQRRIEPLEQLGERRDYHDVDDHQRDRHGGHHEQRIAQRRLDALADFLLELEVLVEPQEDILQQARAFAHAHQADVEIREHPGMAPHRGGQLAPAVQARAQVDDHGLEARVGHRLLEAGERAQHRHAGLEERVHLARKKHQVDQRDSRLEIACERLARGFARRTSFGEKDVDRRDAGGEELVGDGAAVAALEAAADQLASAVAPGVGERRH
jgi:hypothetical protein